jgi:NitT/TauT family transport system ATP-binding protein
MSETQELQTPRTAAAASGREAIITFDRVGVAFGDQQIFENLSFEIRAGEFVCLLGPSGCGKSTALRLIGDLLSATAGRISVGGGSPRANWEKLAYVFQSPRLVGWRTALGNVLLGMELRGLDIPKAEMDARARANLDMVGLGRDAGKYPRMLSGGERQRVAIARALSVDPSVILMDEPFSALDVNTRQRLRSELLAIWQRTGKTIVFVTHDVEEALLLADRIFLFSAKPTRILETIEVTEPRPRRTVDSGKLTRQRDQLVAAFEAMEHAGKGTT